MLLHPAHEKLGRVRKLCLKEQDQNMLLKVRFRQARTPRNTQKSIIENQKLKESSRWRLFFVFLCLCAGFYYFLSAALPSAHARKQAAPIQVERHPSLKEMIPDINVPLPRQPCENWAWAAAIEALLAQQEVPLKQDYWVDRADGGSVCLDHTPSMEDTVNLIRGDYTLDNGRKVHLNARFNTGAPTNIGALILRLRSGQPSLLLWKDHAYVLSGIVYDEFVYPTGQKRFEIRELELIDPAAKPGPGRHVLFLKGIDDPNDIGGTLEITVSEP
jgi:hypothetical protein